MWVDMLQSKGVFAAGCVVQDDGILAHILAIAPRRMAPGATAVLYDGDHAYPPVTMPGWVGSSDFKVFLPYADAPIQDAPTPR
jgi:hypothetical protein